jgi:adenylylsulfate kinase
MTVPVLLVTGTVGVGKSAVALEINETLATMGVPNAAVDLDALVWQWPPSSEWNDDLLFENLAALWPNYRAHGSTHLVLARVLESRDDLTRFREAIPGADIVVCRLVAPEGLRVARLGDRMLPGESLDWHLDRTVALEAILVDRQVEDFTVDNGDRPIRDVAVDVLVGAGWITEPPGSAGRDR